MSEFNTNINKNTGTEVSKQPDPVDVHVGKRIKLRRTMLKVSQDQLANEIGVTFQQIQKYESGHNRVSASRLFDISTFLTCHISYFFEDFDSASRIEQNRTVSNGNSPTNEIKTPTDPMLKTETLEVVRAYWRLPSNDLRKSIRNLLISLSKKESN
mgnify:CR=1 FL=1